MVNPAKLAWGLATGSRAARRTDRARAPGCGGWSGRAGGGSRSTWRAAGIVDAEHVIVGDLGVQRLDASGWRSTFVPVYDYALMTEPLTAAPAGRDRLGRPRGDCRTPATSSTTSGSPPTIGSCGAAMTRSITPGNAVKPSHDQRPATFERLAAAVRRDVPAARRHRGSRTAGAGRSTPPPGSRSHSGQTLGGRVALRAGLHGPRRRRDTLGRGRPPGHGAGPRLGPAAGSRFVRLAPVPDPARSPRARHRCSSSCAGSVHRRRTQRGSPRAVPAGRWTRWGSASTPGVRPGPAPAGRGPDASRPVGQRTPAARRAGGDEPALSRRTPQALAGGRDAPRRHGRRAGPSGIRERLRAARAGQAELRGRQRDRAAASRAR